MNCINSGGAGVRKDGDEDVFLLIEWSWIESELPFLPFEEHSVS